jgi:hypothetical protein
MQRTRRLDRPHLAEHRMRLRAPFAAVRFYLDTNDVRIVTVSARDNKVLLNGPCALSRRKFTIARTVN